MDSISIIYSLCLFLLSCLPKQCIAEFEVYYGEHPGLNPHRKAKMEVQAAIAQSELDSTKALQMLKDIHAELLRAIESYRLEHAIFVCAKGEEEREAYKRLSEL